MFEPEEGLDARASRDTKLKSLGYRPTPGYVTNAYGEGWEPEPPAAPTNA